MHISINGKSLNNTSKWQMGFNWTFKGLITFCMVGNNITTKTYEEFMG
jgi:hypothetical protein